MKEKMVINVYDFDKTIYDGDSTIDFYFFCISKNPALVFLVPLTIFYFVLYKLRIIKKLKFKEKFFVLFLKYIQDIDILIEMFWKKNIIKIKQWFINDNLKNKIIISASPEFLLHHIINDINVIDIIASKVDKKTGKFESFNCYGEEKINRLNEKYSNYIIDNFFSDSLSDIYLAKIANNSFLVKKNRLEKWNVW